MEKYDLAVVGAGQGGLPAAFMAANLGAKVALIEMKEVGGTCLNEGCIPTKTLLRSAEVMHLIKNRSAEFGVRGVNSKDISFDLSTAVQRKNSVVGGILGGIHKRLEANKMIDYKYGKAEFVSPIEIKIDGKSIVAEKTILAVGARPIIPPILGIQDVGFITNIEALDLETLPKSMIIIGAGYVGIEFAQMYARFGTKVTIIGNADRILPGEEPELSDLLLDILKKENIDILVASEAVEVGKKGGKRFVKAVTGGKQKTYTAEQILLATGRVARTEDLGLDNTRVVQERNFIMVNDRLGTTDPSILSIGDANGGAMFTHRAIYDGKKAALNAVKNLDKRTDYRVVPKAVFTQPALASVGLTEKEALENGFELQIGKSYFTASGRAQAIAEPQGMLKVIVNKENQDILGAHFLGEHADILIHEIVIAMYGNGTIESLKKSIFIHPTLSEMVQDVAKAAR